MFRTHCGVDPAHFSVDPSQNGGYRLDPADRSSEIKTSESMKNRWLRIAATAAGWAFLGLVLSLEVYFNMRAEMSWADFVEVAIPQFGRAAMWACLAPFILMLRARMPLSAWHWIGGVFFHISFSFLVYGLRL